MYTEEARIILASNLHGDMKQSILCLKDNSILKNIKLFPTESKFVLCNCSIYSSSNGNTDKIGILENQNLLKDIFNTKYPDCTEEKIQNIKRDVDSFFLLKECGLIQKFEDKDFKESTKELIEEKFFNLEDRKEKDG
ncbi:hypothetical protein [Wolbachia endosymbiont of Pentidionis agamae]|uniref:hypothetical protein n=1 Tax=Wolbachia endosymbiont of Pentidionis agamae TaxID=3110435 RepID=UPI002FCEBD54